ncbi:hypothetical protein [Neorhizobium galegae]|jgi:hypothetical protein|uniref:Uncharacterized protein n=1 Tax=Neorhizobium galegae bv. orientalis str. HAMBI 540 TaxID=1028800 RepID=A0A068SL81_NEOGA|nr:hypothetical protein [Neorhizobium galegae]CDN46569.1 Hypothetical protein RG540_CH03770 [Neorhizobium galegae bv. orientalis str. HAMBI 540]
MLFWSYGAFNMPSSFDEKYWKSIFWLQTHEFNEYDGLTPTLQKAIGCYVFVMARGDVLRPWYVGKTNARSGFEGEIFTPHKLGHYSTIIAEARMGWRPQMLLFPLVANQETAQLSTAYKSSKPLIEWMERTLIGMALAKNPDLFNTRDTVKLRNCIVDGVVGKFPKRHRYPGAIAARKALTDLQDWD